LDHWISWCTRAIAIDTLALANVASWDREAPMDGAFEIELPHFEAIVGIPGIDDASAAHGALENRLDILNLEGEGFAAIGCDDALCRVIGMGVWLAHFASPDQSIAVA
jgi:hypothetical protein